MYNLTKEEAFEAMKEGHKVTREYFDDNEYIYMPTRLGPVTSEDGYNFNNWWRTIEPTIGKSSEKCWKIWRE